MAALHGSADIPIDDEEEHEFETSAQEFIQLNDWHVVATDTNDLEEVFTVNQHQELHPMNILNIEEKIICSDEVQKIPSVLEVIDLENKVFELSAVAIKKAPIMMCHYEGHPVSIVLDTGAEHNIISDTVAKRLSINIVRTFSQAVQVDKSPLRSIGRISIILSNGEDSWLFDAIVCTDIG